MGDVVRTDGAGHPPHARTLRRGAGLPGLTRPKNAEGGGWTRPSQGLAMTSPDISAARDDALRARAQLNDTLSELTERVTSPINSAKEKLNVLELVRNNPWPAIAVAVGAGAFVAASGSDAAAASAAVKAGQAGLESASQLAQSTASSVRSAPSKSREALGAATDALAAKLVLSFIGKLRDDDPSTPAVDLPLS